MAGGGGACVIHAVTITVVEPLAVVDGGEIAVEGDLNGLSRRTPGTATSKQDGVADGLEAVVGGQGGGQVVLHSRDPLSLEALGLS